MMSQNDRLLQLEMRVAALESAFASRIPRDARLLDKIEALVSKETGVLIPTMRARRRHSRAVQARNLVVYLASECCGIHYKEIIHHFNFRSHTSVYYCCLSVKERMEIDPAFSASVKDLQSKLADL